jgi:hypothetical protein
MTLSMKILTTTKLFITAHSFLDLVATLRINVSHNNDTQYIHLVTLLIVIAIFCHRYAECRYAECRYAQCRYAECRYAECRYAECLGARR